MAGGSGTGIGDVKDAMDKAIATANQMTILTMDFSAKMSAVNAKNHAAKSSTTS